MTVIFLRKPSFFLLASPLVARGLLLECKLPLDSRGASGLVSSIAPFYVRREDEEEVVALRGSASRTGFFLPQRFLQQKQNCLEKEALLSLISW
jgi:hypothetical protein